LRDRVDLMFCELPAPKPSRLEEAAREREERLRRRLQAERDKENAKLLLEQERARYAASRNVSMSVFYNQAGGCFDGRAQLRLADGSLCTVADLRAGHCLWSDPADPEPIRVICVTKLRLCRPVPMVLVGGVWFTPYHPVRLFESQSVGAGWQFPVEIARTQLPSIQQVDTLYDLVLSRQHTVLLNERVLCVTLAHGIESDPVCAHPYFGTQRVLADLARLPGWSNGCVDLPLELLEQQRDPRTGQICGLSSFALSASA
jgi:hypothetical protein